MQPLSNPDRAWLAALLEGEGCFLSPPPSRKHNIAIQLMMTDRDVVVRAGFLMGGCKVQTLRPRGLGHKIPYRVTSTGKKAVRLMRQIYPLMGERRKIAIEKAISDWSARTYGIGLQTYKQGDGKKPAEEPKKPAEDGKKK